MALVYVHVSPRVTTSGRVDADSMLTSLMHSQVKLMLCQSGECVPLIGRRVASHARVAGRLEFCG